MPYVKSGDMRVLLLTHRSPELPEIPSGPEIGLPSVSVDLWLGFFVHSKIPKAAYDRLVSAMKATFNVAGMKESLAKAGYIVEYKDPQEFSKIINKDWEVFSEVLKEAGMQAK
jgi:tripartite-type tricarboxylate transporter receptor subunit TctC